MADDSSGLNQILSETSFLYGGNGAFVEELYAKWVSDPASVAPSWQAFFSTLRERADEVTRSVQEPAWTPKATPQARPDWLSALDGMWPAVEAKLAKAISVAQPEASPEAVRKATLDSLRAVMMIRAYRMRGHLAAKLDPLGLEEKHDTSELDPATYGFGPEDYDRPIFLDRNGRIQVAPDLSLPGSAQVFVIGDLAACAQDGGVLPGMAPVAIQQGRQAAAAIRARLGGVAPAPFRFHDRGMMATIGRGAAIAQWGRWQLSGGLAWFAWLFIHLMLLVGFRNRQAVFMEWLFAYLTTQRRARLILGGPR